MTERHPCEKCGREHRSATGLCGPCRRASNQRDGGDLALTGGRWVTDERGIQRWEAGR